MVRLNQLIEPMTLGNMRELGVRSQGGSRLKVYRGDFDPDVVSHGSFAGRQRARSLIALSARGCAGRRRELMKIRAE
jgi:hypothetical protein